MISVKKENYWLLYTMQHWKYIFTTGMATRIISPTLSQITHTHEPYFTMWTIPMLGSSNLDGFLNLKMKLIFFQHFPNFATNCHSRNGQYLYPQSLNQTSKHQLSEYLKVSGPRKLLHVQQHFILSSDPHGKFF